MGCCMAKPKINKIFEDNTSDLIYPRTISIQIKKKGSRGRVKSVETVTLTHTEPILCVSEELSINFLTWASACILPGIDPHEKLFKACQDHCFFSSDGNSIIFGLFDGHGKSGETLSSLCVQSADAFFHLNIQNYSQNPSDFLLDLIQSILTKLHDASSSVDIVTSGCSCVLSLIHTNTLYTANIGNSKSILGTLQSAQKIDPRHITGLEVSHYTQSSNRRRSSLTKQIIALQLTIDHSTNNHSEFMRIVKAGGKLLHPESSTYNKDTTYLVYAPHSKIPGIKLTRSIGDIVAAGIGIVPTPDLNKHVLSCENGFVVIASEGVWEVMSNEDVVEFVAKYRILAKRGFEKVSCGEDVTPHNSCIAQLLCEEARIRWLKVVENEDSAIEDISCVVLEIDQRVEKRSNTFYRMQIKSVEGGENENGGLKVD